MARKIIETKGRVNKSFYEFIKNYEAAIKEGWSLPDDYLQSSRLIVTGAGRFHVELYRDEADNPPVVVPEAPDERLAMIDKAKTKQELLGLASDWDMVVPEDKKLTTSIGKWMKENLQPKENVATIEV